MKRQFMPANRGKQPAENTQISLPPSQQAKKSVPDPPSGLLSQWKTQRGQHPEETPEPFSMPNSHTNIPSGILAPKPLFAKSKSQSPDSPQRPATDHLSHGPAAAASPLTPASFKAPSTGEPASRGNNNQAYAGGNTTPAASQQRRITRQLENQGWATDNNPPGNIGFGNPPGNVGFSNPPSSAGFSNPPSSAGFSNMAPSVPINKATTPMGHNMAPARPDYFAPPGNLGHPNFPGMSPAQQPVLPNTGSLGGSGTFPNPFAMNQMGMPPRTIMNQRGMPPNGPMPPGKWHIMKRLPIWARVLVVILIVLIGVGGTAFAYYQANYAASLGTITGKTAIHTGAEAQKAKSAQSNANPLTDRTNILLLGSDTDGKGNDPNVGTPLAQTVMIITIDPKTNYVGMLSIPRDTQVFEDGYINPKLDETFEHDWTGADEATKAATAAGHIEDVIQANYGITINYYAWVGLSGFIKVINTAGGVDVDAIHPMVDDTYPSDTDNSDGNIYDYERLYIVPGPQHMNGQQALDYVRTRHSDLVGDFGRTIRQQEVITDLKQKLQASNAVAEAPQLLSDLQGYMQTDMTLSTILQLGNFARSLDITKIDKVTLGPPTYETADTTNTRGNYAPLCVAVDPVLQRMFGVSDGCVSQDGIAQTPKTGATTASTTTAKTVPATYTSASSEQLATQFLQSLETVGQASASDLKAIGNPETIVHSLLDLMFMITFESFAGAQV